MNWIRSIFSDDGAISSKRVFGGIGFAAMLVKVIRDGDQNTVLLTLGICAAMLGLETIMKAFKR
jgi:hypothetical protein